MKNIIFLLFAAFTHITCFAQTKLAPGEIKGAHSTFIISNIGPFGGVRDIAVYSKSNKYNNGIPRSEKEKARHFLPMHNTDIHVNNDAIKQIVYDVLNQKLAALKQNKEQINLITNFEPNGKLTGISFGLHENTLITLEDIEKIDRQLRQNIRATFTGKEYLQYVAITYNVPLIVF